MLGDKIKELRSKLGLTQDKLAKITGISRSSISMAEKNLQGLGNESLKTLSTFFGVTLDYLLNEDKDEFEIIDISSQTITIPIIGVIRAGQSMLAEDNIQGYMPIMKNGLKTDSNYFGLKVKGDSMNLEFIEGTILVIEKTPCIANGEIGVIRIDGFEATVKKVVLNNEMITLIPMSNNADHIPHMYNLKTDDIEIIGVVKQAIKRY